MLKFSWNLSTYTYMITEYVTWSNSDRAEFENAREKCHQGSKYNKENYWKDIPIRCRKLRWISTFKEGYERNEIDHSLNVDWQRTLSS